MNTIVRCCLMPPNPRKPTKMIKLLKSDMIPGIVYQLLSSQVYFACLYHILWQTGQVLNHAGDLGQARFVVNSGLSERLMGFGGEQFTWQLIRHSI